MTSWQSPRWAALARITACAVFFAVAVSCGLESQGARIEALDRANKLLERGDARGALAVIEKAAETCKDPRILRLQGYALVLLRRDTEAEAIFRDLVRDNPSDGYATLELAKRLHAREAYSEAEKYYGDFLALRPDHAEARDVLERLARARRDFEAKVDKVREGEKALVLLSVLAGGMIIAFGLLGYLLLRHKTTA